MSCKYIAVAPLCRLVHWALIRVSRLCFVGLYGLDKNDRHGLEELLGFGVDQHPRLLVPPAPLQGQTVHISAVAAGGIDGIGLLFRHLRQSAETDGQRSNVAKIYECFRIAESLLEEGV